MAGLARWRLGLAAGVAGIAVVHSGEHSRRPPAELLQERAATAMARAGFSVERHQVSWHGSHARGGTVLRASHPACAQPVAVEVMGAMNHRSADNATYFYGDYSGPPPGYGAFARNALAMAWSHALPGQSTPRATVKMLAVSDPSACLAVTATDWRWIWFGPDRPAA